MTVRSHSLLLFVARAAYDEKQKQKQKQQHQQLQAQRATGVDAHARAATNASPTTSGEQ